MARLRSPALSARDVAEEQLISSHSRVMQARYAAPARRRTIGRRRCMRSVPSLPPLPVLPLNRVSIWRAVAPGGPIARGLVTPYRERHPLGLQDACLYSDTAPANRSTQRQHRSPPLDARAFAFDLASAVPNPGGPDEA